MVTRADDPELANKEEICIPIPRQEQPWEKHSSRPNRGARAERTRTKEASLLTVENTRGKLDQGS